MISRNAFKDCDKSIEINIPSSVKKIERFAFSGCRNLKTVSFGDDSNLISLGGSVFSDCTNIKEIVLPSALQKIGSYAFNNCTNIEEVSFPASVEKIEGFVFYGCTNLSKVSYFFETIVSSDFLEGTQNVVVEVK